VLVSAEKRRTRPPQRLDTDEARIDEAPAVVGVLAPEGPGEKSGDGEW